MRRVQRRERRRPVERLGHTRHLRESEPPERLHERGELRGEPLVHAGHLRAHDAQLLLERRVVDPEIETPPPQRLRQLTGAIRGEHHGRPPRGTDGAELGDGDLEIGEDLEQERLELLIAPVHFINEQDGRRPLVRDRLQQRALEQKRLAEDRRFLLLDGARRVLLELDAEELLGVVPLVERGGGVEPLVALEPDERRVERTREHLGDVRLPDTGMPFHDERLLERHRQIHGGRDATVRHVALVLHQLLNSADLWSHRDRSSRTPFRTIPHGVRAGQAKSCGRVSCRSILDTGDAAPRSTGSREESAMRLHRTTRTPGRFLGYTRRHTSALVVAALLGGIGVRARAQAPDPDAAAAAHVLERASKAQRAFEQFRRFHLPVVYGSYPCDVRIGRYCYWDDNQDLPLPPEPAPIARERDHLVATLADAAARAPADDWIAGQRVHYLIEAKRSQDAIAATRACAGTRSWCAALLGLALHEAGDDARANIAFDSALAAMPESDRCRWTDLSSWLEGDFAKRYKKLGCTAHDSLNARVWWLAQPLAMRAGRDVRAEFLSRQTLIRVLEHATLADGSSWQNDIPTLLLRYDYPTSWAKEDDGTLRIADPLSNPVVGHEPTPSFDVMPSPHALDDPTAARDDDWSLTARQTLTRYAPSYADTLTPLAHQLARFRRGDSMLVVAAFDVGSDTVWTRHALQAGLVLASSPTDADVARDTTDAGTKGTLTALVPDRAALMSLEVFSPEARRAARARYGLASLTDSTILSDILLLDRKSTRLNSSHPSNSYAVFCLKKKKYTFGVFKFLQHAQVRMLSISWLPALLNECVWWL